MRDSEPQAAGQRPRCAVLSGETGASAQTRPGRLGPCGVRRRPPPIDRGDPTEPAPQASDPPLERLSQGRKRALQVPMAKPEPEVAAACLEQ